MRQAVALLQLCGLLFQFQQLHVCALQEDVVSETAQMSWGEFKPRLADAVGSSVTLLSVKVSCAWDPPGSL